MKLKKALSSLLALVLLLSCMSITAFAASETELKDDHTTWTAGENLKVSSNLTMSGPVTVTGNVTLNIAENVTLTIVGTAGTNGTDGFLDNGTDGTDGGNGLTISSGTLTLNGAGTLSVTGGDGGEGGKVTLNGNGGAGGDGGHGVCIDNGASLVVSSGTLSATGGAGGHGGNVGSFGYGGNGGNGGTGVYGDSITISGGTVECWAGTSGTDGGGSTNGSAGSCGKCLSAIVTMTAGKLGKNQSIDYYKLSSGSSFSGGIMSFSVPSDYVAEGYECVANTDSATSGTYRYMVQKKLLTITNSAPKADEATKHGYITLSAEKAAENAEITVTAYPENGYKLDTLTYTPTAGGDSVNITNGTFPMPAAAVTVSATFSEIQTTGENINLDLEESDTYPDSTTIDQYYTKTEASSIVDTHRIGVTWWTDAYTTLWNNNLVVQVNKAVKWDPSTLSWVEDETLNGVASVQDGTDKVNFKLSNYSTKAFKCEISYAANADDTKANKDANTVTFDSNNGGTLAMVENDINNPGETNSAYLDENNQVDLTKVPTLTITGTVGVDLDGFKNAEATSSAVKYGRFTVTCTAVTE